MSDWIFALSDPPTAEELATQAAWDAEEAERQQKVTACASRSGGHAWTVEGTPEEAPWLACADCPARADDLMPDLMDVLDSEGYEIGGRTILFGADLPGVQSSCFTIPVDVRVETRRYYCHSYGSYEYDIEVHITDRPAGESKGSPCPTAAGAPCGCCDRCLALQVADPRYGGSPSDWDAP